MRLLTDKIGEIKSPREIVEAKVFGSGDRTFLKGGVTVQEMINIRLRNAEEVRHLVGYILKIVYFIVKKFQVKSKRGLLRKAIAREIIGSR